jgi:protein subunit release factor B
MSKKELLFSVTKKDLEITWFSGHGPGGQNRNKCQNCCRIHHPASGATTTGQEQRDRSQNQKAAFRRLVDHPKFKIWWQRRVWECLKGETVEQRVEREMRDENIRTEVLKDGKWVVWDGKEDKCPKD